MSLIRIRYTLPGGEVGWFGPELLDYDAPYDLTPQAVGGSRAVDSALVVHTGDWLPTEYAYTLTGQLHATSPGALDTLYFRLKSRLRYADQAWRGDRHLKLTRALIGGGQPLRGQCVVPAPIVCAVRELRWYDADGRSLE